MGALHSNDLIHGTTSTYHLCGIAGRGGWGIIYKARDIQTGAEFALKMSREQLYSQGVNALLYELELVQRIQHPAVVKYMDHGHHNQRPILVMELIEAPSLSRFMAEQANRLSHQDKVTIIANICDAVAAIHEQQVIHCDLKPQNIIIYKDLSVKIVDFGLAKGLEENGEVLSQFVGGTPNFMAPEQLTPKRLLSRATDVYAVAIIVIWLFSANLWDKTGYQLLLWRLENPSILPDSIMTLPTPLQTVLKTALKLESDERLSDIESLKRRILRVFGQNKIIEPLISPAPLASINRFTTQKDSYFNTTFLFTELIEDTIDALTSMDDHQSNKACIALVLVQNEQITLTDRLKNLQSGLCEDLVDLLNVSDYLNLTPFTQSASKYIHQSDLNDLYWIKIKEVAQQLSDQQQNPLEYLLCLSLAQVDDSLKLQVSILALEDELLIAKLEDTSLYANILNQLGGIARDIAHSFKVSLNTPHAERTAIAESVDLLFAARAKALDTWHTDVSEAIQLYRQSIALSPEDFVISSEAARVEARASFIGQPPSPKYLDNAKQLAEQAYQKAPNHPQPLWALGYVRFYEGKRHEALQLLDQALLFGGERAEINDLIGRILTEEGPIERALTHLEHAFKLNPKEITTRLDLSRLYAYLSQWEQVDELLCIQVESDSDYGALAITRARLSLWRGSHCHKMTYQSRNRTREGTLFSNLIDIFQFTYENGQMSKQLYESLFTLFTNASSGSRLAALYSQFIVECLAFSFGAQDPRVTQALNQAKQAGVNDQLWLTYCPLLSDF